MDYKYSNLTTENIIYDRRCAGNVTDAKSAENWVQPFGGGLKMLTIRSDNLQAKTVLFMHLMFTIVSYCRLFAISVGRWSKKWPVDKNGAVGQVCMGRIVIGLTKT